ncbi:DICT sensory domain-containing protein [Pseudonocardia nematodicida]|uniref:DICT sensory domain-containing protein n=1 Tax=Pseudonocardia nematodicida TaxID=1206997 RepID=A0ABV1KEH5_9PSEU
MTTAASEGPLAHAVRVASEEAYVEGLAEAGREAYDRASGARPEPASKRLLVHLSHSIERAVMSAQRDDPTVVVALFQRLAFFDREREVYARMAEAGIHVVVGFVDGLAHDVPEGIHLVTLRPDEPLADEWTVVAVGPRAGAFLVATDQHARDPRESAIEAGRVFLGRWGYSQAQAGSELARLRFALGDRLDESLRRTVDDLLASSMPSGGAPAASAGTPGEAWATASLNHMIDRMLSARAGTRELRAQLADAQQAAAARAAAEIDPVSGLPTGEVLQRWTGPAGPETLPVGVLLVDVPGMVGDQVGGDDRTAYFAAHQIAAALTQPLGPVDAAVRLSEREFAVVVPGSSLRHLAALADRVGEQLELASQGYPGVPLRGRVAAMVTRTRPLPVADLRAALAHLPADAGPRDAGPVDAGRTPAGERIIVAGTALQAAGGPAGRGLEHRVADGYGAGPANGHAPVTTGPRRDTAGPRPSSGAGAHRDSGQGNGTSGLAGASWPPSSPVDRSAVAPDQGAHAPAPQPAPERPSGHRSASGPQPSPGPRSAQSTPDSDRASSLRPRPYLDAGGPPVPPARPADPDRPGQPDPQAQEALRRLVYGDADGPSGDPRARGDVFADLSDQRGPGTNGHRG